MDHKQMEMKEEAEKEEEEEEEEQKEEEEGFLPPNPLFIFLLCVYIIIVHM